MKFEQYNIADDIKKNLIRLGFKRPTDIQFKTIPSILKGEDVLAIAQTGTGKTAAFAIPIIDKIQGFKTSKRSSGIKCIVMVPTRELASQIGEVFKSIARHTKVKPFALFGGVEQDHQIDTLVKGVDILITTPGRMFDLINQKVIQLRGVSVLVLDEADHMLQLGFIKDIQYIKKMLPARHQTLFFSATISDEIKRLAYSQVKSDAIRVQLSPDDPVSKNVSHFVMYVDMDDKRFFLEKFITDHPDNKILVFVRTRVRAERVVKAMDRAKIATQAIHGDIAQSQRSELMSQFKTGQNKILIATDISARGINIVDIDFVINYDLPNEPENYVHRVGRTGRGVRKGSAISFCAKEEEDTLRAIQELLVKDIEVIQVGKSEYREVLNSFKKDKSVQELIEENEKRLKEKKRKKSKKKKK